MTKYATVVANLLSHPSRSDFDRAVKERQADKGIRSLSTLACFEQMAYGQLAGI
jgi:hypothetical protein